MWVVPVLAGLGIACVALDLPVTSDEANNGLVPIAAAQVPFTRHNYWPSCNRDFYFCHDAVGSSTGSRHCKPYTCNLQTQEEQLHGSTEDVIRRRVLLSVPSRVLIIY